MYGVKCFVLIQIIFLSQIADQLVFAIKGKEPAKDQFGNGRINRTGGLQRVGIGK